MIYIKMDFYIHILYMGFPEYKYIFSLNCESKPMFHSFSKNVLNSFSDLPDPLELLYNIFK